MRYADSPTTDVELFVGAPPERVWDLVTDLNLIVDASPELVGVRWLDGATGPAVGARFVGTNFHRAVGEWETTSIVIDLDRPKVFAWADTDVDHPSAIWRFTLRPRDDGTVVRQWAQLGPGPSFLNHAIDAMPDKEERIIQRRLSEFRAGMTANLARIKELSETAS